eukprot:1324414-Amorphochlora_amoeboformis.AAC.2
MPRNNAIASSEVYFPRKSLPRSNYTFRLVTFNTVRCHLTFPVAGSAIFSSARRVVRVRGAQLRRGAEKLELEFNFIFSVSFPKICRLLLDWIMASKRAGLGSIVALYVLSFAFITYAYNNFMRTPVNSLGIQRN